MAIDHLNWDWCWTYSQHDLTILRCTLVFSPLQETWWQDKIISVSVNLFIIQLQCCTHSEIFSHLLVRIVLSKRGLLFLFSYRITENTQGSIKSSWKTMVSLCLCFKFAGTQQGSTAPFLGLVRSSLTCYTCGSPLVYWWVPCWCSPPSWFFLWRCTKLLPKMLQNKF